MAENIFGCCIVGIVVGIILLLSGIITPVLGSYGVVVLSISCIVLVLTFLIDAAIYLLR